MISDPWDFGTECGVGPFFGSVTDLEPERVLVLLEHPIKYSNAVYMSAKAQVRHEGTSTDDLNRGGRIPVNITLLSGNSTSLAEADRALNERFRAIGTIELS